MIDIETDTVNQHCVIKSDKMLSEIYVEKENSGYIFFRDKVKTKTLQRNEYADKREIERNGSKSKSKGS